MYVQPGALVHTPVRRDFEGKRFTAGHAALLPKHGKQVARRTAQ